MAVNKNRTPKPTAAELGILRVLWRTGPATVRQVHAEINGDSDVGYTTVLKMMQIMADKRLLLRDESERAHVYKPAIQQQQTEQQLVGDLLERVFGGSAAQLVQRALSAKKASAEELRQIRQILDDAEKEARK